jgi:hypothetical protein
MTEPVTELLRQAVTVEPRLALDLETITARGARLRRRQRAVRGAGAVATAALLGAGVLWFPWASPSAPATASSASIGVAAAGSSSAVAAQARPTSAVADAVEAAAPDGVTFAWAEGSDASGAVGTVDDGRGAAGVSVGLSTSTQQVHPCQDAEFAAGATCTEKRLADGAVLSRRGLATGDGGVRSIAVVLTYPDGSGVNAEADNAELGGGDCTLDGQPTSCAVSGAVAAVKPSLRVARPSPVLTLAELVDIVLAVDAATG